MVLRVPAWFDDDDHEMKGDDADFSDSHAWVYDTGIQMENEMMTI